MVEEKQSFTLDEIAQRWGVSHSTVLTLVYQGTLRGVDVSTNPAKRSRYIVMADDLAAFEEQRRTLPPNPPARRRRIRVKPTDVIEFIK